MNGIRNKWIISVSLIGILFVACEQQATKQDSFEAQTDQSPPFHLSQPNPDYELLEKGSLIIVGGAMRDSLIFANFLEKAGGANAPIIVIPTASADLLSESDLENARKWAENLGASNVHVLHTKDRQLADSEEFTEPIRQSMGVWFGGGRQWRIADSFLNTRTHEEIKNLLKRGGVVGGSSAGATIQGTYLARGDTKSNLIMMGDHEDGMNFFPNTAIDQHLLKRNRQFDMVEIIERFPELLGIGLDENTAILVSGDSFEVIGSGYVAIYDAAIWEKRSLTNDGKFFLLSAGDHYNYQTRKVISWSNPGRKIESLSSSN